MKNYLYYLIVYAISCLLYNCTPNPFAKTNRAYKQHAKTLLRSMQDVPQVVQTDSAPAPAWRVGTTNFNLRKPNFVIIHHTAQNSCLQTLQTFTLLRTQVSAHYVICKDGSIHHMLNDYLRAWHGGVGKWGSLTDINSSSLGIELDNNGFEPFPAAQISSLLVLLDTLKLKYSIPAANFIGHADIAPTRKNDPNINFPWKMLAGKGFGSWYGDTTGIQVPENFNNIQALRIIGYDVKDSVAAILAFKRHFVQDTLPFINERDLKILYDLAKAQDLNGPLQQAKGKPLARSAAPLTSAIRQDDLKHDLFDMAGDHFRGREAGTLDELKVSVWLADQARAAGLAPAGDDNTYFQFFSLWRNRVAPGSSVRIGDSTFHLWKDVLIAQTAPASVSAPVVLVREQDLGKTDVRGKAVALRISPDSINRDVSLFERRYPGYITRKYAAGLLSRGAAAIIFIADELGEKSWSQVLPALTRGLYDIEGGPNERVTAKVPVIWVHGNAIDYMKRAGLKLQLNIVIERFEYPSMNVVGKIQGTDPGLSGEYVLFSGHQDHDGIRQPYGQDSIFNGADDNASVSVALLAIARAFHRQPGRRSAIFVWHGAEERGLLGSRWFADHPTIPKASIVAVLNGDMIGRNAADSAALLGVTPPHRNSPELVAMALDANNEGTRFKLDTLWDKVSHVEGWYFRSDHLPYARAGIPSLFFTTLLHPDYHTPMDEASRIDIAKLKKMTEWMYRTGWKVATLDKRPALEPNFRLER